MNPELFTPGPVRVPAAVLAAVARQPLHHHSKAFRHLSERVWLQLRTLLDTGGTAVVMAGSAMTGIEAAIISTVHPGQTVVVVDNGRFAERLATIVALAGGAVHRIVVPWGTALEPAMLDANLDTVNAVDSLWMVHSETSTGVTQDVAALAATVRRRFPDVLIGVDAVTSLAIHPFHMDPWGIDLAVAGIQKGLCCPPGLACVGVSERALARLHSTASYTLDLLSVVDAQRSGGFVATPPVGLVVGLDVALTSLAAEGYPAVWQRHVEVRRTLHDGLAELGLPLFGAATSCAVTVVRHPDSDTIRQRLLDDHGMVVAGGQGPLAGTTFRIGTCGSVTSDDIRRLLRSLALVLHSLPQR